ALEATLDRHARNQSLADEAIRVLLRLPYGSDEDATVGRSGCVVDLPLGQPARRVYDLDGRHVLVLGCAWPEMRQQVRHACPLLGGWPTLSHRFRRGSDSFDSKIGHVPLWLPPRPEKPPLGAASALRTGYRYGDSNPGFRTANMPRRLRPFAAV